MQLATMPEPPKHSSGSVRPLVGSTPMFTPMLMNACKPSQMPMPCAASAAKCRSSCAACRPIANARATSQSEQRDHQRDAGEAELLGDHREQEIGVRFGQVEQLLDARAQADAEPLAAPEGDQRVRQLVALAERVGPRVHEAEDALHAVRRREHQQREAGGQQREQRGEVPPVHAAEKQDRERRSPRSPPARRSPARAAAASDTSSITASIGSRPRLKLFMHRVLARRVVGGVEHHGELHRFGGLEAERPAGRASGARR